MGAMKPKDYYKLLFPLYSLDRNGQVRLRLITGSALSQRRTRRQTEWKKRQVKK